MKEESDILLPRLKPWALTLAGALVTGLLGFWFIMIDYPIAVPGNSAGGGPLFVLGVLGFFGSPVAALVAVGGLTVVHFKRKKQRRQIGIGPPHR